MQTRLQKATDFRYKHKNTIRNMTRQGLRYEAIDSPLMTDPGLAEDKQMSFPGLPYNFYHLELTDLETTALVLESFLLAQRRGVLPEEISAIKLPNGKAVRKALDIEKLFQGTLKTLKTMQSSDGSFDAGNRAGPVIAFNKLPEVTIPSAPALTRKLESERGDRYTIAGFRALRALNELAAKDRRAQRQMSSMLKSATKAVRDLSAQADNLPAKPAPIKARMSYLDNPSLWV